MYGTQGHKYQPNLKVTFRNAYPGGSTSYICGSFDNLYPVHASESFSRSGENFSGIKGSSFSKFPGTVVRIPVAVRNGPRLSYKVYSKRLKKYVWARMPIQTFKMKRVKSKIKSFTGNDIPPNRLSFNKSSISYFGGDDGRGNGSYAGFHYDPRYNCTYTGPLWSPFLLRNQYVIGPNPQNFMTVTPSDRLTNIAMLLDSKALTRLYSKVKNQKVNLAQALAERAQTSGLILDMVSRLVRAVKAARRGNLVKAASNLFPKSSKELANDWLVLQYGIKPLLSDIEGAVSILQDGTGSYAKDIVCTATKQIDRELITTELSNGGAIRTNVYRWGKVTVRYKARLAITNAVLDYASKVGLSDVNLLAWELIPFSFVVDWLLPIGNYLQNKDAFSGLKIIHLHKTVFIDEYVSFEREFISKRDNSGYFFGSRSSAGFINHRVSCNRSILTNVPDIPKIGFKNPLSALHIANSIALLRQLRK